MGNPYWAAWPASRDRSWLIVSNLPGMREIYSLMQAYKCEYEQESLYNVLENLPDNVHIMV